MSSRSIPKQHGNYKLRWMCHGHFFGGHRFVFVCPVRELPKGHLPICAGSTLVHQLCSGFVFIRSRGNGLIDLQHLWGRDVLVQRCCRVLVDVSYGNVPQGHAVCKLPCRHLFCAGWSDRPVGVHELRNRNVFTREFGCLLELPVRILPAKPGIRDLLEL